MKDEFTIVWNTRYGPVPVGVTDAEGYTVVWDPSGIRPVLMCYACTEDVHELCVGKSERRHWFRRLPCGCAEEGHSWNA
jgi:hypothetical protein